MILKNHFETAPFFDCPKVSHLAACGVSSIAEVGGSGRAVQPLRQSANAVCRFISDTPKRMFSAFQTE